MIWMKKQHTTIKMQLDLDVCNKICQPSSRSSAREREPAHDLDQKAACYKDLDAIGFGKTQDDCMIKMRLDPRRATLQQAHRSEQIWAAGHARLEKKMQMGATLATIWMNLDE